MQILFYLPKYFLRLPEFNSGPTCGIITLDSETSSERRTQI